MLHCYWHFKNDMFGLLWFVGELCQNLVERKMHWCRTNELSMSFQTKQTMAITYVESCHTLNEHIQHRLETRLSHYVILFLGFHKSQAVRDVLRELFQYDYIKYCLYLHTNTIWNYIVGRVRLGQTLQHLSTNYRDTVARSSYSASWSKSPSMAPANYW